MPSEVLAQLEKLVSNIHGNSALRFEQNEDLSRDPEHEPVDAAVLEQLLYETYANSGRSTEDVAKNLLRTIEDYDPDHNPKHVSLQSFARFVDVRMKRLRDIFNRIDTDKDATITLDDVYRYLQSHNLHYDPKKVAQVYAKFDRNNDGRVSYDDFLREMLLVPNYSKKSDRKKKRFFYRAYDFFTEDLEISQDNDVVMSVDLSHGLGYFYAGGIAGVISRTCTAPFDRLKVYLIANSTHHAPLKIKDAIVNLYKNGNPPGIRAFFVGNGLNIIKVFPESAMKFGGFEFAKRIMAHLEGVDDPADLSPGATFVAGGLGGMVSQLCVYPIDTVKFRVQCASQSGRTDGHGVLYSMVWNMIHEGGIPSFYRGLYVGVLGIFPFSALDLGIFSALKAAYIRNKARSLGIEQNEVQLGDLVVLSMGAVSGSIGASVVYPVNLVRTRIQTQGTPAHPFTYTGFTDCWRQSVKREGWRGLFRGLGPNLMKVAPSVAISYLVYEKAKKMMHLP